MGRTRGKPAGSSIPTEAGRARFRKSLIWGLRPSANWSGSLIRCHRSSPHAKMTRVFRIQCSLHAQKIYLYLTGGVTVLQGFRPNGLNHLCPEGVESASSNAQKKSARYDISRLNTRLSDVNAGSGCVQLASDASEKKSVRNTIERWTTFVCDTFRNAFIIIPS